MKNNDSPEKRMQEILESLRKLKEECAQPGEISDQVKEFQHDFDSLWINLNNLMDSFLEKEEPNCFMILGDFFARFEIFRERYKTLLCLECEEECYE